MGKAKKEFDHLTFEFRKASVDVWRWVRAVLIYMLGTLTLAVIAYAVLSLVFSTDLERRLRQENRMYRKVYSTLTPKVDLIEDAVASLQYKDNDIYEVVFRSKAPDVDPMAAAAVVNASDSIPERHLQTYTAAKADSLLAEASKVDAAFDAIIAKMSSHDRVVPPMSLPVSDLSYLQVGASVGRRMNPFLKAYVQHGGLDLLATRGTPVFAAASGTVKSASFSRSSGNTIRIEHAGGYETVYAHLESMKVRSGQKVGQGALIGTTGMSGKASAPHLHYEVLRDGVPVNPVDYLFASLSSEEYADYLYMSVNTLQSMD